MTVSTDCEPLPGHPIAHDVPTILNAAHDLGLSRRELLGVRHDERQTFPTVEALRRSGRGFRRTARTLSLLRFLWCSVGRCVGGSDYDSPLRRRH
ncbi:hypothetical protein [Deinococcus sp. 23YEL01]|uniref:hypothetical protein n=1 Tax=Deinococcus sp. 23YEL01 TaxID=2745871 RepID=UPI001E4229F6|nr:hypothetical protein [Deinococcus sp. 23YEL01]MCD0170563.1 hypothetical protein [Deinococcus sp. 23YEL01]